MTVTGTSEEINNVIQGINPNFPRQNLESIHSSECFYVVNGAVIEIVLVRDDHDAV